MCVCQTGKLQSKFHTHSSGHTDSLVEWVTNTFLVVLKVFPDVGSNAAVISLQDGPVVEGDVKVMFESSAVSVCIYTLWKESWF